MVEGTNELYLPALLEAWRYSAALTVHPSAFPLSLLVDKMTSVIKSLLHQVGKEVSNYSKHHYIFITTPVNLIVAEVIMRL